ncbi:MAG: GerAB/ArcD/ProY family transporter [Peptococcales bacterium]|jgi:putative heme degradation protein
MNKTFKFQEKIYPQALMILIFIGLSECILIHFTYMVVSIAGRDAWLVVILGSLFSFLLVYLLITLANRFPKETFFRI